MKLNYTLTRESVRQGAGLNYNHRMGKSRYVRLLLGVIALGAGAYLLLAEYSRFRYLGMAMIAYGVICFFRKQIFCLRVVRRFFKALEELPEITVAMTESAVEIESKRSNGRMKWADLVDYQSNDDGILLYPQEGTYYWIPANAVLDGGSWDDVLACVRSNVQRKS